MQGSLEGIRVFIVDDDEDNREMLECFLVDQGAEVRAADGADLARSTLETWMPDVLLIDLTLEGEDGCELLTSLRANHATRDVPAIAVTGHTEAAVRERAERAGFQKHMAKPIELGDVVSAIVGLTSERAARATAT